MAFERGAFEAMIMILNTLSQEQSSTEIRRIMQSRPQESNF